MVKVQAIIEWGGIIAMKPSHTKALLKSSWLDRGEYWHKQYRKRHFTLDAVRRYGYQERTKAYNKSKLGTFKIALPLVYTGVSRALSGMGRVTATHKEVKIVSPVTAFNFKPIRKDGKPPIDMQKEFRTMSDDEIQAMDERQTKFLEKHMNAFQKRSESIGG
jgi:hypothetical protein